MVRSLRISAAALILFAVMDLPAGISAALDQSDERRQTGAIPIATAQGILRTARLVHRARASPDVSPARSAGKKMLVHHSASRV